MPGSSGDGRWQADLVLRGGRVFTGSADGLFASALAIRAGRVLAQGEPEELKPLIGPRTRVIELDGRLALPGFHDAHTHLLGGALAEDRLDCRGVRSSEELAERVGARIAERGAGQWVLGRGWDADELPGGRWPERGPIDAVSPETPVLVRRRDGHAALANACALRLGGISKDTPDPPGGQILRGSDGEPSGILLEDPAFLPLERLAPAVTPDDCERALVPVLERCLRLGITSVQDDPSFDDNLRPGPVYAALYERGQLPVRTDVWRRLGRPLSELAAEEQDLAQRQVPPSRLRYGLLKGYLDGSLGSRTALMFAPFADAPPDSPGGGTGVQVTPSEDLIERALAAHAAGYQVGLHAIGDRANALGLDVFQAVGERFGQASLLAARHRIEHAQLLRRDDIRRFARLGVVASVQPIHLASDMRVAAERLGPERCGTAYPWRSFLAAQAPLACGTDYPVEPLDPLPGVFTAVTRRDSRHPDATAFQPDEALGLADALFAYTAGPAWACHRESVLGRLTPGAWADVAVLNEDPFRLPPDDLPSLRCTVTIVAGEVVWEDE